MRGSLDDGLARLTNVTKILDRKLNDTDAAAAQIKLDASKTREAVGAVGEGLEAAKARLKTAERDIEALKLGLEGAADREVRTSLPPVPSPVGILAGSRACGPAAWHSLDRTSTNQPYGSRCGLQWLAKLETAREDAAAAIKQLERMETELDRRLSVAEEDLAALATDVSKTAKTVPWLTSEIDAVKRSVRPCSTKPSPSCHSASKRAKLRCGPSVALPAAVPFELSRTHRCTRLASGRARCKSIWPQQSSCCAHASARSAHNLAWRRRSGRKHRRTHPAGSADTRAS